MSKSGCPGPLNSVFENQQASAMENRAAQNLNTASHKTEASPSFATGILLLKHISKERWQFFTMRLQEKSHAAIEFAK